MSSLIEQIKTGSLWDFPGGIHPSQNKLQSNSEPLVKASIPTELVLPVKQHIGKAGDVLVNVGDKALKGQQLTDSTTSFMLPVHAPTSGTIIAIEPRTVAHPSGLSEMCIVLQPDGMDTWKERNPRTDYSLLSTEELIDIVRQAGISGMGGAGFPVARKLQSGLARTEMLIVNAAECEPYITADDTLMQHHAEQILVGLDIVSHILKPKLTIIGIEDNKPEAIKALQTAAKDRDIVIRVIPTKYPSGGEKQLIKILTNKEVPSGGIPADIGIVVHNIGSLFAIKEAVIDDKPMIERVVTLTGKTFKQPRNVWALIGTSVDALLNEFNYKAERKQRLIMGGPMMGFTLPHTSVPLTKTTNCILAPTKREIAPQRHEMECIRCGECASVCPTSLLPQQLQWHAKSGELDKCEELNLKDCIECGACSFVCPSQIPLVQYYRQAKAELRQQKEEADASERARQRFEQRKARLERDKEERENRFNKAAETRRQTMQKEGGNDAVAAAIARVKAQKETPKITNLKPAVASAIAKAKAKQAAAAQQGSSQPDNTEMMQLREERKRQARARKAEKAVDSTESVESTTKASSANPAVAAAIARAKARKSAQQTQSEDAAETVNTETQAQSETETVDPKKAAVAAAIARAKARKAAQQTQSEDAAETANAETQAQPKTENADPKKAAVAAAIARAKARKSAQQTQSEDAAETVNTETQAQSETETVNPKKAAVAAAIARAKARKAAQQTQSDNAAETINTETQAEPETETVDPKKAAVAAVAAAIARAKARKAAQQTQSENAAETVNTETQAEPRTETVDPKKAAVAAAIARAKARKAAQQTQLEGAAETVNTETQAEPETETVDPKKAAVAAAIARAKARKAAQEQQKLNIEEKE